jgi:hypothetical protein
LHSASIFSPNLASCICALRPTYCAFSKIWVRFTLYTVRPTFMKSSPDRQHYQTFKMSFCLILNKPINLCAVFRVYLKPNKGWSINHSPQINTQGVYQLVHVTAMLRRHKNVNLLFRTLQPLAGIHCSCGGRWDGATSRSTALWRRLSNQREGEGHVMPSQPGTCSLGPSSVSLCTLWLLHLNIYRRNKLTLTVIIQWLGT